MDKVKSIKFNFEGEQCRIKLTYRGKTTIALIVIGKGDMTGLDRNQRVYCGVSSCNPCDTYDIKTGIKLACRGALLGCTTGEPLPRRAAIYREIRKALNPNIRKTAISLMVEEVFDKLPADLPATIHS